MTRKTPLRVIEQAENLAAAIYRATEALPRSELYGLSAQMRRAAVSIGSNLAEGSARPSDVEFARFVGIADGSASELHFQLRVCRRLGYGDDQDLQRIQLDLDAVRKQMRSLRKRLREASQ